MKPSAVFLSVGLLLACSLPGCRVIDAHPTEEDEFVPGGDVPEGDVQRISLIVPDGEFFDTDANGYRDTARANLFLYSFPAGPNKPVGVRARGSALITLLDDDNTLLARWEFSPEQLHAHFQPRTFLGPGYVGLILDINAVGSDRLSLTAAGLNCVFREEGGSVVPSRGPAVVTVGPIRQ